jgi:hypothetical protein
MTTEIESYLNSLSYDTLIIDISGRDINEYVNINDCPSNGELEEYMRRNFHWIKDS